MPEELHAMIAERAHARGLTVSEYLLRRISELEGKPEIGHVLDAHWSRSRDRKHAKPGTAAALLAKDRHR